MTDNIKYPENKDFIFTIFDDTDVSVLENIRPIYDYLYSLGIYTTKSVWPVGCREKKSNFYGSASLEDDVYAAYIKKLSEKGFEIAFHGASMESSTRDKTLKGLNRFADTFGFYPRSYACHATNKENIYWGEKRFCFNIFKTMYKAIYRHPKNYFCGHDKKSPFFWADLCYKHFDYVRTFTFNNINLLNINHNLLYSNKYLPYFKSCFITSHANNVEEFNRLICIKNQDKLVKQKGICIISTHFGKGFIADNKLHPVTEKLLKQLSCRNGWFAPVSSVLDFLKEIKPAKQINDFDLFKLEAKWFMHSIMRIFTKKKYAKTEIEYLKKNDTK